MILNPKLQVQKGVAWVFLRSRPEIAHVVIWQLKHTSVLRVGALRTQPIFRMYQVFKPWGCQERVQREQALDASALVWVCKCGFLSEGTLS